MEFPQDQLILFKAYADDGSVAARYGLFDLGYGTVDDTTIAQTLAEGIKSFTYFYDVTNKKSVEITFLGEARDLREEVTSPVIAESKGPNPVEFDNGYVAFEDLPDEQRHLPGESEKSNKEQTGLESLLSALDDEIKDDDNLESQEDATDNDEEEENIMDDEDGMEIFDGSEELTL